MNHQLVLKKVGAPPTSILGCLGRFGTNQPITANAVAPPQAKSFRVRIPNHFQALLRRAEPMKAQRPHRPPVKKKPKRLAAPLVRGAHTSRPRRSPTIRSIAPGAHLGILAPARINGRSMPPHRTAASCSIWSSLAHHKSAQQPMPLQRTAQNP